MAYVYTVKFKNGGRDLGDLSYSMTNVARQNGMELVGVQKDYVADPIVENPNLPFKTGDLVMINGDLVQGEAKVLACWQRIPHPKWDRPSQGHPQVEVEMLRNGVKYHFNGDDLTNGKVKKITRGL